MLNYDFENSKIDVRLIQFKQNVFLIKKILEKNLSVKLFCHSFLLKTELKIKKFKRFHFVQNFDNQNRKCISMSFLTFIDDFKFYRKNYRIFMKIYIIIIVLRF